MKFLDKLKEEVRKSMDDLKDEIIEDTTRKTSILFESMPKNLEELKTLNKEDFKDYNRVVALTVLALCLYPVDKKTCIEMLNYLKGPKPLSTYEKQFLNERFMNKPYLAVSYLKGASYKNNYEPTIPYEIEVITTSHSDAQIDEGYIQLFVKSGGADSVRGVKLRKKESTDQWFLWENLLLVDIRKPENTDPWA